MSPTINTPRTFTTKEIETQHFDHRFNELGPIIGGLVILRVDPDGYMTCSSFCPTGLTLPYVLAWSGCLEPSGELKEDEIKLAAEARKIASVAQVVPLKEAKKGARL